MKSSVEDWADLGEIIASSFRPDQLKELSLWSWSYSFVAPLLHLLVHSKILSSLQKFTCSASDLDSQLIDKLPESLTYLTICTHAQYAPLEEQTLVQGLISRQSSALEEILLYNPDASHLQKPSEIWQPLLDMGVQVSVHSSADLLKANTL